MIPDYYKFLNIPPDASLDIIKKAYRTMAMRYHPDRGGNHKDMVLINEAWEVLSHPQLRHNYDYARTHKHNYEAQERASTDASQAQAHAENYPQDWNGFEKWMDQLFEEYGKGDFAIFGIKAPSGGKSVVGWIFIAGGAALGVYMVSLILPSRGYKSWHRFIGIASIIGGAWFGAMIHKLMVDLIIGPHDNRRTQKTSSSTPLSQEKVNNAAVLVIVGLVIVLLILLQLIFK
jgi:curved DNA-binding protein CbpA